MTDPKTFRCHDADACALGQLPCPTPAACGCSAPCPVKDGTHQPAEALQQITEPAMQALRERLRFTHMRLGHAEHFVEVRASVVAEVIKLADRQSARIAELEAEVDAERRLHGIRNASAVRTLHALGYSWRGTDTWQPAAPQEVQPSVLKALLNAEAALEVAISRILKSDPGHSISVTSEAKALVAVRAALNAATQPAAQGGA